MSCGRNPGYPVKLIGICEAIPTNNCPLNYSWSTSRQGCGIIGAKSICTKIKWDINNSVDCCLGILNTSEDCSASWCPGSEDCGIILKDYCSSNNGQNIKTHACQGLCLNPINSSIQTWCDLVSISFCSQIVNKDDPYCGCINTDISPLLRCIDSSCDNKAYRTKKINEDIKACLTGDKVFCSVVFECIDSNNCKFNPTIVQNCIKDDSGDGNGGTDGGTDDGGGDTNDGTSTIDYTIYYIIGAVILLVIIIIIIGIIIYFTSSDNNNENNNNL